MLMNTATFAKMIFAATATAALLAITPASAADAPTADEIKKAVSDHTYQGSMSAAASGFAEYYAADGSIKAKDYSGKWRADDGVMCFQYGDSAERCFGVEIQGPSMIMIKGDKIDGNGMLIPGNVNNF